MNRSAWLIVVAILSFIGLPPLSETVAAGAEKSPEIEAMYPTQVLRGETTEITVRGKHFDAIQSVEISLPEGLSVREIRKAGKKEWKIVLFADSNAPAGERSLVLVTPQGRSAPRTITIPSHLPVITNLTVVSTARASVLVEWEALVMDEAGDLGSAPMVTTVLRCDGKPQFITVGSENGVTQKSKTDSLVRVSAGVAGIMRKAASCEIEVTIDDKNGYSSKPKRAPAEFK